MTDITQGQDTPPSAAGPAAAPDVDSLFPKQDVDDLFPADYKPPAAPADRNISPIHDFIYSRPHAAEGRVLDAFGYGFAQNWGATQQQMTDADEYMRKAGIWDDYSKGQHSIIKAANEAVMRPAVSAFLAAKGTVFGLLPAGQAAVEQIGKEVGLPELGHEVAALPEAFPAGIHQAAGIPHVPEAPRPPVVAPVERVLNAEVARQQQGLVQSTLDKIAEAKELGVIGAGEDGYFGTKPAVEAALGPEATAAKQAGVTAKEWNETLLGQKPEGAVPSPVVQPAPAAVVPETAAPTPEAPPPALPPIIPQAIVDQERAKLIAAGRPPEEAEAWAKVVAAHYQARAERFEGAKGSAEDLYAKEAPEVKSRGKSVEMAQTAEEGGELNQLATAPPFYSAVGRAVDAAKQDKASPEQWLGMLKNTAGVKPEEMQWLGLEDWLKEQKGSVTKAQVQDFVRANQVEVKEVGRGGLTRDQTAPDQQAVTDHGEEWKRIVAELEPLNKKFETAPNYEERKAALDAMVPFQAELNNLHDRMVDETLERAGGEQKPAKYSDYSLPGGENYRNLLLTLPERREMNPRTGQNMKAGENYRSSHWEEPNILAHIRFDDRISDGKKTLHVAEVQSDWHQAGKKKGYQGEAAELVKKEDTGTITAAEQKRLNDIIEHGTKGGVPDAPFKRTEDWAGLAMKRVLRYAAENGYERVSWDTGATNAERFDLSKQVNHIDYIKNDYNGETSYDVHAYDHSNNKVITREDLSAQELADTVGKEAADKIVAGNGKDVTGSDASRYAIDAKRLSNLDLKVGGEGMAGFYDKILPVTVNKLVKKFGGKVEDARVTTGDREIWQDKNFPGRFMVSIDGAVRSFPSRAEAEAAIPTMPVHAVDITPQLRDTAVGQGFPLFQVKRGKILLREGAKSIITLFNRAANASTIIHETGHQWLEELMSDARDTQAPQSLKDDASTILKWFKVDRAEDIKTEHHELFARGFERYMMEGKAPTPQLASVFEKFKAWLSQIYQSVLQLKAPINDQVRGVFDRLITVRPEEEARAPSFADIHEADAEYTPPAQSREGAQTVASERDRIAATHVPEENNERLEGVGNRAGRLPTGGEQPGDHGNAAGAVPEEEGAIAPTGEVGAGGTETAQEGAGARKAAERVNKAPTPLLRFIAERGGISARDDLISDLRQSIGGQNRFVPGLGQLIREPAALSTAARRAGQSGAMTLDRAREAAIEAGMLPEGSSIRDLLDRMDQELRGHAPPESRPHNDPAEIAHAEHSFVEGINDAVKEAGGAELSDAERTRAIELWRHEGLTDPAEIIERLALEADDTEVGKGAPERAESIPGWDAPAEPTAPAEPRPAPGPSATAAPSQPAEPGGPTARTGGEAEAAKPNPVDPSATLPTPESSLIDKAGNIRLDNLNVPEDVKAVIRAIAEELRPFGTAITRGRISDAEVLRLADALGMTPEMLAKRKIGEAFNAEQLIAATNLLTQSANELRIMAAKVAGGTAEDALKFTEAHQRHQMIQEQLSGATAESGRALRALGYAKRMLGLSNEIPAALQDIAGRTLYQTQQLAAKIAVLDTTAKITKVVRDSERKGLFDWIQSFFVNGLISGPFTHVGYTAAGQMFGLFRAVGETSAAAFSGKVRQILRVGPEEAASIAEMPHQLYGMYRGNRLGIKASWDAWKANRVVLPAEVERQTTLSPATGQTVNLHQTIPNPTIGEVTVPIGTVLESPSRLVAALHSFNWTTFYCQSISGQAFRQAMKEKLEGHAFSDRVGELTQSPTDEMIRAASEDANGGALMQRPRYDSFTGQVSRLTNWGVKVPDLPLPGGASLPLGTLRPLKFIDPFVQVQANIQKTAFGRGTPLALFSQSVRDDLSMKNGGVAFDLTAGRILAGTSFMIAMGGLAAEGLLNHSGPSDPKEARAWQRVHGMPHGLRIGDLSFDTLRLGPMGMQMSVAADLYHAAHTVASEEAGSLAADLIHAFTKNILDESSMRGPAELLQAVEDHDRYGAAWVRNFASSFIPPFSVGLGQITRQIDPYSRSARTTMDAIKAKIPFLSEELMPRRDIWGEPVPNRGWAGTSYEHVANDPVDSMLYGLRIYPAQPERTIRGIKLTDQQYDDYARISGRYMKMRLNAMVNTPGYAIAVPDNAKIEQIREVISSSREFARSQVIALSMISNSRENPDINEAAIHAKIAKLHPAEVQP